MKELIYKLKEKAAYFNIELSDMQLEQFLQYYNYLMEVNKTMNLTRITEPDDVIQKHFLDSLALAKYVDLNHNLDMIDLGTGAGFPGIPLKIVFQKLNVTLVDSLNKKVKFLQNVIDMLELENIQAVHSRAEDLSQIVDFREKFDLCVSRAVANLSTLSEYCIPFVKIGGYFVSYKSGEIQQEASQARTAIKKLGGNMERIEYFNLSDSGEKRSLLFIEKISFTKKMYPRKAGTPLKDPLT